MSSLSQRLEAARIAKKLSQRQLAALCELPPDQNGAARHVGARHVGMIESGERDNITTETAAALAQALGCSLDWLLLGKGDAPEGVNLSEHNAA